MKQPSDTELAHQAPDLPEEQDLEREMPTPEEIQQRAPNTIIPRLLTRKPAPQGAEPLIVTTNAFIFVIIWYDLETLRRWYRLWNNHHQSPDTHIVWHQGMRFIIHDTATQLYTTLVQKDTPSHA